MSTPRSIDVLIRQTAQDMKDAKSAEIADAVIDRIDPDDYPTYLRQLIVSRVSSAVGAERNELMPPAPARSVLSTKQAKIRDEYWPRFLQTKIALPNGYKTLAEATSDDLRFLADMRMAQAKELMQRGQEFTALADLMDKSGVKCLEELGKEVGTAVIQNAA